MIWLIEAVIIIVAAILVVYVIAKFMEMLDGS
jgi:hypothetical protein